MSMTNFGYIELVSLFMRRRAGQCLHVSIVEKTFEPRCDGKPAGSPPWRCPTKRLYLKK